MGENLRWQGLARQGRIGSSRGEIGRALPVDRSLRGPLGVTIWRSKGKTRPEAHTDEWYYVSPHFICSIDYDFTGMYAADDDGEFPSLGDSSKNVALTNPTLTLVEPARVKKYK